MKYVSLLAFTGMLLMACNSSGKDANKEKTDTTTTTPAFDSTVAHAHNAQTALDYKGVYAGTVPCASCEGIVTTLTLKEDSAFTLTETYEGGKEGGTFNSKGTYMVKDNKLFLKFADGEEKRVLTFKLGENKLSMLDADEKVIEGDLAANYVLTKK